MLDGGILGQWSCLDARAVAKLIGAPAHKRASLASPPAPTPTQKIATALAAHPHLTITGPAAEGLVGRARRDAVLRQLAQRLAHICI